MLYLIYAGGGIYLRGLTISQYWKLLITESLQLSNDHFVFNSFSIIEMVNNFFQQGSWGNGKLQ